MIRRCDAGTICALDSLCINLKMSVNYPHSFSSWIYPSLITVIAPTVTIIGRTIVKKVWTIIYSEKMSSVLLSTSAVGHRNRLFFCESIFYSRDPRAVAIETQRKMGCVSWRLAYSELIFNLQSFIPCRLATLGTMTGQFCWSIN